MITNSVYGKTIENLQKRINVRLVNNEKDSLKHTSRPTHITHKIFGKTHAAATQTVLLINEFVGLKSKMNSMKNIDGKESNTAKEVNIATEFNEFKDTLFNKKIIRDKLRRIQGKKHKMGTYKIKKSSLSCFDEKRFVSNDGIHMLPYFCNNLKKIDSRR